jgi:hypothetical protein
MADNQTYNPLAVDAELIRLHAEMMAKCWQEWNTLSAERQAEILRGMQENAAR